MFLSISELGGKSAQEGLAFLIGVHNIIYKPVEWSCMTLWI